MAIHVNVPPRFVEVKKTSDETKKTVKLMIDTVPETEALIAFEEDIDKKLIGYLKTMARGSYEYKEYIKNFKENLGYMTCMVFNIDVSQIRVGLEVHHTPFSMETITKAVLAKMIDEKPMPIDPKDVADEVMKLHYEGKIGLIPLTSTIHEAVHSNAVHIKKSDIFGDYQAFYKEYEEYLEEEAIDHYNNVMMLSDDQVDLYNKERLKRIIAEYDIIYDTDIDPVKM